MAAKNVLEQISIHKRELKELEDEYNQHKGILSNQLKTLKQVYQLNSIAEAKKHLIKLKATVVELEEELQTKMSSFEEKYVVTENGD